jgi:dimethylamine monooxygenase subunit A
MLHGIEITGEVDWSLVLGLSGRHMQDKLPPEKTVMVNTYPQGDPNWLEIDATYPDQIRQRFEILARIPNWVIARQDEPEVRAAEVELRDKVVSWLTTQHPQAFVRHADTVTSKLTGVTVDVGPNGADPMAAVAMLASEDMLLLVPEKDKITEQTTYRLQSGALLFPNGWSLRSHFHWPKPWIWQREARLAWTEARLESLVAARLGKSPAEIHAGRVSQYENHYADKVDRMMAAMPPERVTWRRNWGPHFGSAMFRHPDHEREYHPASPANLLRFGTIRSEHETFVKLPQSGAVVFGIKTYQWPVRAMFDDLLVFNALAKAYDNLTPEMREYRAYSLPVLGELIKAKRESLAPWRAV